MQPLQSSHGVNVNGGTERLRMFMTWALVNHVALGALQPNTRVPLQRVLAQTRTFISISSLK